MNGTVPMPADGDDGHKAAPDGVSGTPERGKGAGVSGRTDAGETGGGAYPNPHAGKSGAESLDHGGQSEMRYFGSGQAGGDGRSAPNSVAGSNQADDDEATKLPAPSAERQPHAVQAGGRSFEVVETSGVAAAEASGKVQSDADKEPKDESKLAG